jgi:hypothetical protein
MKEIKGIQAVGQAGKLLTIDLCAPFMPIRSQPSLIAKLESHLSPLSL